MPSSTSSSDPPALQASAAKRWLAVFATGFALVVALLALTFLTPPPYGDLTRLGALSEHLFGWREPQPALNPQQLASVPIETADILVVGDSFSVMSGHLLEGSLMWQSRLVEAGWRVTTLHWDRTHPLCPDFNDWLAKTGFKGRWVLLESVERALDDRLTPAQRCGSAPRPQPVAYRVPLPLSQPPAPALNTGEQLLTGLSTLWNSWRAERTPTPLVLHDPSASDRVRLHPLPGGCARFSHAACDKALFLLDDETKPPFSPSHLPALTAAAQRSAPWRLGWIIVPNKRTYVLDLPTFAPASAAVARAQFGPDVLSALKTHGHGMRDLYLPNDTHLSPRGSLLVGDAVLQWLQRQSPR